MTRIWLTKCEDEPFDCRIIIILSLSIIPAPPKVKCRYWRLQKCFVISAHIIYNFQFFN